MAKLKEKITTGRALRVWCEEWHMRPASHIKPRELSAPIEGGVMALNYQEDNCREADERAVEEIMSSLVDSAIAALIRQPRTPTEQVMARRTLLQRMILWRHWEPYRPPGGEPRKACNIATRQEELIAPPLQPIKVGHPDFKGFSLMPGLGALPPAIDCIMHVLEFDAHRWLNMVYAKLHAQVQHEIEEFEKREAEREKETA